MTVSDMVAGLENNLNSYAYAEVSTPYGTVDLKQVPIKVIRPECRQLLCKQLNGTKMLLSEEGLPRDWRGILQCLHLRHSTTLEDLVAHKDPFGKIFERWQQEQGDMASLDDFQAILGRIDRWDVLDDTRDYFGKFPIAPSYYYGQRVGRPPFLAGFIVIQMDIYTTPNYLLSPPPSLVQIRCLVKKKITPHFC